ncbi:MAG TPA: hypothetical protein VHZ25_06565 [Acidobacteriaceae bacterium]|jgi:hypothetical protein|nr:hypothetical protein [Acidobacteriaceae bacterium]
MLACPRWAEVNMANEAWMDSTHVRVTSEDGTTSYLYEVDSHGERTCTEIAERKPDGSTNAYMPARALDDLFWGGRSRHT